MVTVHVFSDQYLDCQDIIGWVYSDKGASVKCSADSNLQIGDVLFSINDIEVYEKAKAINMATWLRLKTKILSSSVRNISVAAVLWLFSTLVLTLFGLLLRSQ